MDYLMALTGRIYEAGNLLRTMSSAVAGEAWSGAQRQEALQLDTLVRSLPSFWGVSKVGPTTVPAAMPYRARPRLVRRLTALLTALQSFRWVCLGDTDRTLQRSP